MTTRSFHPPPAFPISCDLPLELSIFRAELAPDHRRRGPSPGGRTTQQALCTSPLHTRAVASSTQPAESKAASAAEDGSSSGRLEDWMKLVSGFQGSGKGLKKWDNYINDKYGETKKPFHQTIKVFVAGKGHGKL